MSPATNLRWGVIAILVALPTVLPIVVVLGAFFSPDTEVWSHLISQVLPRVTINTFILVVGVTGLATVLGVSLAWLTSVCEFPGRRFFAWALFLPLAIPAYVLAFVFLGWFEFAGPIQTLARSWLGSSAWIPDIRNAPGVILTLTLALFPYPYLLARNAFLTQGIRTLEAGQSFGLSRIQSFFKISLPMARPWIISGAMLVLMETLADFGAVSVFNYDTFTTAIYKSWFGLFSITGALQLAGILVLLVLFILGIERWLRGQRGYSTQRGGGLASHTRLVLRGWHLWGATLVCGLVFLLAFLLPVLQLIVWTLEWASSDLDARYIRFALNSISLASMSAVLVVALGLLLGYAARQGSGWLKVPVRVATLGYALPGAILAVGLYASLAFVSGQLQGVFDSVFSPGTYQVAIQGTLAVMLLAYVARFMAVAYGPVESNLLRVTSSVDDASKSMGLSSFSVLTKVHIPIIKSGVLTAMALVFVDTMKELPITLMTRPLNWETLAVRIFEMTSEGYWERAALPGLSIVLVGVLPVAILIWSSERAAGAK